jgi:hypothetical protein
MPVIKTTSLMLLNNCCLFWGPYRTVKWNLWTDESGWSTPRPGRFSPGKWTRYPLYRRLGWAPRPVRIGAENLDPTWFFFILLYCLCTCVFVSIVLHFEFCLTTHNTNIHALGGIRTRNPSKRTALDLILRLRDHRDWLDSNPRPQ